MERVAFVEELADIIEADISSFTLDSDFRKSADFWSSLVEFGVIIFMQDRCGVQISADDLTKLKTVGELYALVQ